MKVLTSLIALLLVSGVSFGQKEEFGIASYYGEIFHGKPTASGELYDRDAMTAAHKSLPFGTIIKVTNQDNNKSVLVRVNDRGPHISGRIIDVSNAAAKLLDIIRTGTAKVSVVVVTPTGENEVTTSTKVTDIAKPTETVAVTEKPQAPSESPKTKAQPNGEKESKTKEVAKKSNIVNQKPGNAPEAAKGVLVKGSDYQSYDLYQVQLTRPEKKGFGVQVAALSSQDALFRKIADLQGEWFSNILISVEPGPKNEMMYKVILGPFPDNNSANIYKDNLRKNKKMDGFVVDLATLQAGK